MTKINCQEIVKAIEELLTVFPNEPVSFKVDVLWGRFWIWGHARAGHE